MTYPTRSSETSHEALLAFLQHADDLLHVQSLTRARSLLNLHQWMIGFKT
jgi:hypothetical protein